MSTPQPDQLPEHAMPDNQPQPTPPSPSTPGATLTVFSTRPDPPSPCAPVPAPDPGPAAEHKQLQIPDPESSSAGDLGPGAFSESRPPRLTLKLLEHTNLVRIAQDNEQYAKAVFRVDASAIPVTRRFTSYDRDVRRNDWVEGNKAAGRKSNDLIISFSMMHSTQAAKHFIRCTKSAHVSVMNFANGENPGGGYLRGARAQEEALCRQFPLYHPSLWLASRKEGRCYPFGCCCSTRECISMYTDVLVTPDVECMRDDGEAKFHALPEEDKFKVTFVAAAAPNLWAKEVRDDARMVNALENVLWAPVSRDETAGSACPTVLILGAWGCGAFGNEPKHMALLFTEALRRNAPCNPYSEIHFAVPCFNPKDRCNPTEFRNVLREFCQEGLGYELKELNA